MTDSLSENFIRLLNLGLLRFFSFSLPPFTFAEIFHCFAKHRLIHQFVKVFFNQFYIA